MKIPEDGVEDDEELAHGAGERELLGFAGADQAPVAGPQRRVVADRDQSSQVEHRAHPVEKISSLSALHRSPE
jgi:hypothetical protein